MDGKQNTPTKRKASVAGFVQCLSPKKMSKSGNPYYTFQLQTDENKCLKGVCFSPLREKELRKFEESKTATELAGILLDGKGDVIVNGYTKVANASFTQVPFQYKLMKQLVKDAVSLNYEIAGLKDKDPGTETLFTVKGYVMFDDLTSKTVNTACGVSTVKEGQVSEGN